MPRPPGRVVVTVIALTLGAFLPPGDALAQGRRRGGASLPRPTLLGVFPTGVKAGETVEIEVRGSDLDGATILWFDHPGLRAFHLKGTRFRVACAPGTPPGHHDVRAFGTFGVTNPRTFVVGGLPESLEAEPNNSPTQANVLAVNSVVNGEVTATDVDHFAFEGRKGQRVWLDLEAERVDSRLDATLRLFDAKGRELAESRDAEGADPFLDVTLPDDGRYVVKLHDVIFRGSNEHPYRLTLSDGPHVDAIIPGLATPGRAGAFTLVGRNLGGEPSADVAFDGRPLERKVVTIDAPAADGDAPPASVYVPSSGAIRRGFEYALTTPKGRPNPVFVGLATDPVVAEVEPNDDPAKPQEVTLPCDVSGRFGTPGDLDVYRFRARKGEVWVVEATADAIGSPADPQFVIQRVTDKGEVQDLVTGDDTNDRGGLTRFGTASVDASVRWQAAEDGVFQVAIADLYASQRGDVRLAYRLNVRPERPDFRLVVLPEADGQPDALSVGAGGRGAAVVLVVRSDGFNGPVLVSAEGLPEGVRCEPVVVASGQSLGAVVFAAAEGASPGLGTVRLVGRSRFGDRKDDLSYLPGTNTLGPDLTREAIAGAIVWPTDGAPQNPQRVAPTAARVTRGFAAGVTGASPLELTARPTSTVVAAGSPLVLDLSLRRRAGFAEAVTVTPLTPSARPAANGNRGAAANQPTLTIAKDADRGTIALPVPKTTSPGTYTVVLHGTGNYPFNKDPKAKDKPNVLLDEPSNAVTYVVRATTASLTTIPTTGTLKPGASQKLAVTVSGTNLRVDKPVTVRLVAPDRLKLSAEPVDVFPGKAGALVVNVAADAPPGLTSGALVVASVPDKGGPVDVAVALAFEVKK